LLRKLVKARRDFFAELGRCLPKDWMAGARLEPDDLSVEPIRRGWSFRAEDFIARLLDRLPGSVSEHHLARERSQTDEQTAESINLARLKELGWGKTELATWRKSDPNKVALARDLRAQTR